MKPPAPQENRAAVSRFSPAPPLLLPQKTKTKVKIKIKVKNHPQ